MAFPTYTKEFHTSFYSAIDPKRPELSTAGKTIVITGGGSGIGPRLVNAFAASGATKIAILGRTESTLLKIKKETEATHQGVKVLTHVADVADATAVNKAFSSIQDTFGPIDILVQNAAYLPNPAPVATTDIDEFMRGFDVNVRGTLVLTQAFLKHAVEHPTLIHVSTAGVHAPPMPGTLAAYAGSKLAAAKITEYLAFENPHLRLHNVHPGVLATEMNKKSMEAGLVLPFDDVELTAAFMVWIASPEAEFLKGRFVWSNWDVNELIAKKEEFASNPSALTLGLNGWP